MQWSSVAYVVTFCSVSLACAVIFPKRKAHACGTVLDLPNGAREARRLPCVWSFWGSGAEPHIEEVADRDVS